MPLKEDVTRRLAGVQPLTTKEDMPEAARRWEAFYEGEIIDRPVACIYSPRKGFENHKRYYPLYKDLVLGDVDMMLDKVIATAEATFYGGESVPSLCPSMGPDEMAVFCGGKLSWPTDETNTNWSYPAVDRLEDVFDLAIDEENWLWKRLKYVYRRSWERCQGKVLLSTIDLHSNMDLLSAVRGPQTFCMDLLDDPELVDRAMMWARSIFPKVWNMTREEGHFDEAGYFQTIYSVKGAATLQCDFSVMISPSMFDRWVLPAVEEEAAIVGHAMYHWDGYEALKHFESVMGSQALQTISFIPGAGTGAHGKGEHIDFLEPLKEMQKHGKSLHIWAWDFEQLKLLHKELDPTKVAYYAFGETQDDAERMLEWLKKNT